jgi:Ring finger domain
LINNTTNICYSSYKVAEDANCPVCLEALQNTDAVAHDGMGKLHALHRKCAKAWAVRNDNCPICRVKINAASLATWEDMIPKIKKLTKDSIFAGGIGTVLGGLYGTVSVPLMKAVMAAGSAAFAGLGQTEMLERALEEAIGSASGGAIVGAGTGAILGVLFALGLLTKEEESEEESEEEI